MVWQRSSALTRRQMLRLSAAAAGATALAPVLNWSAHAKKPGPSSIAIVGAFDAYCRPLLGALPKFERL
jgi:hypothetical protein